MGLDERMKISSILSAIEEDLKFCQTCVECESRLELTIEILRDIISRLENDVMGMKLTEEEQGVTKNLYQKARILLHRTNTLISIRDKEQEKFLPKRV